MIWEAILHNWNSYGALLVTLFAAYLVTTGKLIWHKQSEAHILELREQISFLQKNLTTVQELKAELLQQNREMLSTSTLATQLLQVMHPISASPAPITSISRDGYVSNPPA